MKRLTAFCVLAGTVALIGCGGGGSGVGGSTRATVFLTDSFREDFAHVWATIYHVELVPQDGGSPVVLFDDTSGRQIDLKTLRDSSGARYSFLGNTSIPAGTYTSIQVTVGTTMQLMKAGTAVGDPLPVDTSLPVDSAGHPILTLTFRSPKTLGSGTNNLIIDFDLARFVLRNSKIIPALAEGDGSGLTNPAQHECDEYRGTVSGLTGTAPNLTFTLNRGSQTVTVTTTASTALFGDTLAEGSVVDVEGTLDPTTQTLVATQVQVRPAGAPGHEAEGARTPRVAGAASAIDTTAGTFTLTPERARGFLAQQTTVAIVTNSSTVFRGDSGATITAAEFFTALATTPNALVEGTYDSTNNTLTATGARVFNPANNGGWLGGPHGFRGGEGPGDWGHGAFGGHH